MELIVKNIVMQVLGLIISCFFLQISQINMVGKYSYRTERFSESIQLYENQKFVFNQRDEFINFQISGNYIVSGNILILDSSPQRDKIIVKEQNTSKSKNKKFNVTNKRGEEIHYQLHLNLENNTQKIVRDCYGVVKVKSLPIKSFYLIDTKGLKSPEYFVKGKHSNSFDIQFETIRVFENEDWQINLENSKIRPRGDDGELQNYSLLKE